MARIHYRGIESLVDQEDEKIAIVDFLNNYWDVRVEGRLELPQIIDYILDLGVKYGIALREERIESKVRSYNGLADFYPKIKKIDFARTSKGKDFNFGLEIDTLKGELGKVVQISAKPKNYASFCVDHPEDFPEDNGGLEFRGTKLHSSLEASCFNFEEALSRAKVKYDDKNQGRDPFTTLISTIFRQGANLGILVVEQRYRAELESWLNKDF